MAQKKLKQPKPPSTPATPQTPSRGFPQGLAGSGLLEGALDKIRKRRQALQGM